MTISDDPWRDLDAEREAIAKLALGDMDAFVARAAADVGFPFEPEALDAPTQLFDRSLDRRGTILRVVDHRRPRLGSVTNLQ